MKSNLPQKTLVAIFSFTLALGPIVYAKKKPPASAPGSQPTTKATPEEIEASYARSLEKRAENILTLLQLTDLGQRTKVHDAVVGQYRALKDWHDTNDPKLKKLAEDIESASAREQADSIKATLKPLHDRFISDLSAQLPADQVDKVKDKMVYGKVMVTYNAYLDIVPNLTEPEKVRIMELLKEAREEAIDGGNSAEKSAIFKKYKGKIVAYLNGNGHDVAQDYKNWGERQKAKAATQSTVQAKDN
jgi:hypothetical protein